MIAIIVFLMVIFEVVSIVGITVISKSLKKQQENSYVAVLEVFSSNLSDEMELIDNFMLSSVMLEGYARDVVESTTETDRYLAEIKMKKSFREESRHMEHLSGMAWYAKELDTRVKMIREDIENGFDSDFQNNLNQVIGKMQRENHEAWFFHEINENRYLVRVLENQETYMVGWMNIQKICDEVKEKFPEESANIYLKIGHQLCSENIEGEMLLSPQNEYKISVCAVMQEREIYNKFMNPYAVIPVVILLSILMMGVISVIVNRYFVHPMNSLRQAMIKMQEGDFDVRIDDKTAFSEFVLLNENFDRMAEKIKELKIEVYEKQLEKQKVELQYLQHQINPHFLTNCMNTIQNLLIMGRTDQAETFTRLLSANIRYDLSAKTMVLLKEEIAHVQNYIALQQVRYENQIRFHLEVDSNLLYCEIPNMIIQTFVENSIKHEICPDEVLEIFVQVQRKKDTIFMEIKDNGDGFLPEILFDLRKGNSISKNGVEHIGIKNVVQRLEIVYQGQAWITFYNDENGAVVNMVLPMGACNENE